MCTDASNDHEGGSLGGVAYDFNSLCIGWFGESITHDVLQSINPKGKKTLIYGVEALASVLGCLLLLSNLRQCDVLFFIDSEVALSALISGRSDCPFVQYALTRRFDFEERSQHVVRKSFQCQQPCRCSLAWHLCSSCLPQASLWSEQCVLRIPCLFFGGPSIGLREASHCVKGRVVRVSKTFLYILSSIYNLYLIGLLFIRKLFLCPCLPFYTTKRRR